MKVVVAGSGRLTIDIVGLDGAILTQPKAEIGETAVESGKPEPADPPQVLDLEVLGSAEEGLLIGLLHLLRQHYVQTNTMPTRNVLTAAREALDELIERGTLEPVGNEDGIFLAKLLAIVEQLTDRAVKPFLGDLVAVVRRMIVEAASGDDDGDGEGNGGNGVPGAGAASAPVSEPGGGNGVPGNGNPR